MEQTPLLGAETMHGAELIEERQRQLRDLLGMRLPVPAAPAEGPQPLENGVLLVQAGGGRADLAAHEVGHEPVAQAPGGDLHLLDAQLAHDAFEDGGAGVDDVDAGGIDAELLALLEIGGAELVEDGADLGVGDRPASARSAGHRLRESGNGAGRSRRPDDPAVLPDQHGIDLQHRVLDGFLDQLRLAPRDRVVLDEELAQPDRAEL